MLNRKGFTLVELMIVVAIIGILAAIAIPNFVSMQYKSKRSEVPTNLKAIKTAEVAYESNFDVFVTASAIHLHQPRLFNRWVKHLQVVLQHWVGHQMVLLLVLTL